MHGTREENGGAKRILEQVKVQATNLSTGTSFLSVGFIYILSCRNRISQEQ